MIAETLIFFSYYSCQILIGLFVFMCHDVGDLMLNAAKMIRDLRIGPGWFLDGMYGLLCVAWVYPRCIATSMTYIYWGCIYMAGGLEIKNPHIE